MIEKWKPVVGWESIYSVSNLGRIRRDAGGRGSVAGRILTTKRAQKGYRHVDLSRNNEKVRRLVHQLVAEAFLPPRPTSEHFPNHIDANKSNNKCSNLEWLTRAENNAHARKLGLIKPLHGESNGRAKLTSEDVKKIRKLKDKLSQREIARRYGVARSLVQRIHQGKLWKSNLRVRQFPQVREGVKG